MADDENQDSWDRWVEKCHTYTEESLVRLAHLQGPVVGALVEFQREYRQAQAASAERFARMMALLEEIIQGLNRQTDLLEGLPNAIANAIAPYVNRRNG